MAALIRIVLGSVLWAGLLTAASAHPLAPAMLQLQQTAPTQYAVEWRISLQATALTPIMPAFPPDCASLPATRALRDGLLVQRWQLQCQAPLTGRPLRIDGLEKTPINVVLRLQRAQGADVQALLDGARDTYVVPAPAIAAEDPGRVFAAYLQLGVEHLLSGLDHLLFVLGLMLLARRGRALLLTITAFTLGHSLTLGLAVLGVVRVHAAVTELLIALSIVWLALAVVRDRGTGAGRGPRRPWALAGGFGLLHGLGFAGALARIGVPADAIPLSLTGFNLGIELGQLAWVAVALGIVRLWRTLASVRLPEAALRGACAYLIGSVAACWVYERLAVLIV